MKSLIQRLCGSSAALLAAASLSATPASAESTDECPQKMTDLLVLISNYKKDMEDFNKLNQARLKLEEQAYGCRKEKFENCDAKFRSLENNSRLRAEAKPRLESSLEKIKEDISSVRGECQNKDEWHKFVVDHKIYSLPKLQID